MGKLLIFTAPSGAGKTTIVKHLLTRYDNLAFSVSVTTRAKRPYEVQGRDYYFVEPERFQELIQEEAFVEWEEVYPGMFYGTLRKEVERIWGQGQHVIFDIDVNGAANLKSSYPEQSLAVFVKPPSLDILEKRLRDRATEDEASFQKRWQRVKEELDCETQFDQVLINDKLDHTLAEARQIVEAFLNA